MRTLPCLSPENHPLSEPGWRRGSLMETKLCRVKSMVRTRRPQFASVLRMTRSSSAVQEETWILKAPWASWSCCWDDSVPALSPRVSFQMSCPFCPFSLGSVNGIWTCGISCRHWEGSVCSLISMLTWILTSSCVFSSFCLCPSLCSYPCLCLSVCPHLCLDLCFDLCFDPYLDLYLCHDLCCVLDLWRR